MDRISEVIGIAELVKRGRGRPKGSKNKPKEGTLSDPRPNGAEDRLIAGLDAKRAGELSEGQCVEIHRTVIRDPRRPFSVAEDHERVLHAAKLLWDAGQGGQVMDLSAIEFRYADAFECLSWLRRGAIDAYLNRTERAARLSAAASRTCANKNIRKA